MSHFTYLHIHTHFSLGGGPASPEKWCRQASALGYKAIGIADRTPLAGFPRFEAAAHSEGLTPVFGVELDLLLPGSSKSAPLAQPALLFACDHNGMSNLARVCSLAHEGWPGVEAGVPVDRLIAQAKGLVVILLGGDEAGALAPLMSFVPKKRNEIGNLLRESFGERAFLGVPHSGRSGDGMLAGQVVRAAGEMGLPPVALPTARYLDAEDAPSYEALRLARQKAGWPRESAAVGPPTGSTTSDSPGPHYVRPPDEAAALFAEWPEALENVARIVEICSGANRLTIGTEHVQGEDAISLAQVAERKLLDITGTDDLSPATRERLYAEVAASEQSGRVGSWLALASLRELASDGMQTSERTQARASVPLGAAPGMADGSLLAYALGLSSLDPLPHAAPRWLAGSSQIAPLPGMEVPASKREALVSSLSKEYGPNRTAYAACATDITPNAAISAVATILGVSKEGVRELAGIGQWGLLRERGAEAQDQKLKRVAALACSLEGAPVTFKPDYSTLLTAPRSMFADSMIGDWLPVMPYQSGQSGQSGKAWAPWCEEALCKLRYPALSIQPSYVLSALEAGLALAARYPTSGFSVDNIDVTKYPNITEQTAQVIIDGRLAGVPYISHEALKSLQGEITPESMALLVARSLTCGVSPGKEGITAWEEATSDTGGLLIYKDQLDPLLSLLVGPEPDAISAMRTALRERSDDARALFVAACHVSGLRADSAKALWSALSNSATALISRSSAHAWGRVALWSAMLKAHHPATLLAGALDAAWERGARDQLLPLFEEAQRLDISVRPPDVDRAPSGFGLERAGTGWAIVWGLARLPGWNMDVADRFLGVRPAGGFSSFEELVRLASRVGLTQTHIEMLIRAGGCDRLGGTARSRYALLEALPATIYGLGIRDWGSGIGDQGLGLSGPIDMFTTDHNEIQNPKPKTQNEEEPTPRERSLQRSWEMKNLGIGFTPADEIDNLRRTLESSGDLKARLLSATQVGPTHIGQSVSLVGLLTSLSFIRGAAGHAGNGNSQLPDDPGTGPPNTMPNTMSVAWIEDVDGSIELIAFPPNYKRHREQWTENSLVIVTARVCTHENDDIYLLCEHIAPFYAEAVEEGFSIKVKAPARGTLRKGADKSVEPGPTSEGEIVASVVAPHTTPLHAGNGSQPASPVVSRAVATEEISSPTYSLIITLPAADNDNAAIDGMNALRRLLSHHPGADTVTLRIPYSPATGSVTSAQLPYGVQYSHRLETEIAHLFGPAALAVIEL